MRNEKVVRTSPWFFVAAASVLLSGCDSGERQARELTVLYSSDVTARREKLKECKASSGVVRRETKCLIAADIEARESIGSFRDLPPMNLQVPTRENRLQSNEEAK